MLNMEGVYRDMQMQLTQNNNNHWGSVMYESGIGHDQESTLSHFRAFSITTGKKTKKHDYEASRSCVHID